MGLLCHYILAAGGTGGHMLPAYATGAELLSRGHKVTLLTNERGAQIPGAPTDMDVAIIDSASPSAVSEIASGERASVLPMRWARMFYRIAKGRSQAMAIMSDTNPAALLGFGGYPSVPAILAARSLSIPIVIHEQNAVMGRANRLLAKRADAIALSFKDIERLPPVERGRIHFIGNPVRADITALRAQPYPSMEGPIRVMVIGGSLGATILAEIVPRAFAMLPPNLRHRFEVVQQCRREDLSEVKNHYSTIGLPHDCAVFFEDIPARLRHTHLFIGRAGASTIAELSCAGRPAIFVPYPTAADDHQTANARVLAAAGGARLIPQANFTAVGLAKYLHKYALYPRLLENLAEYTSLCGRPYAAQELADLLEMAGLPPIMTLAPTKPSSNCRSSNMTVVSSMTRPI